MRRRRRHLAADTVRLCKDVAIGLAIIVPAVVLMLWASQGFAWGR